MNKELIGRHGCTNQIKQLLFRISHKVRVLNDYSQSIPDIKNNRLTIFSHFATSA
jgi:hypothetical protein